MNNLIINDQTGKGVSLYVKSTVIEKYDSKFSSIFSLFEAKKNNFYNAFDV